MGFQGQGHFFNLATERLRIKFKNSFSQKPLYQPMPNVPWIILRIGGSKVCINGQGHMAKMAFMPIHGKNLAYTVCKIMTLNGHFCCRVERVLLPEI